MNFKKNIKTNYAQIVFVFLSFALLVTIGSFFVSNVIRKESAAKISVALSETDKTIQAYLKEPKIAFDNIYASVQDILDRGESNEVVHKYLIKIAELMLIHEEKLTGFTAVYGYINDEFLSGVEVDLGDGYIPQQRPWFQMAIRSEGAEYTAPYIDANTGWPIISLAQALYGINGDYYGVLSMDIDISWLMAYAETLQFTDGGYGMIVNQYMYIIAHPQPQYRNTHLREIGNDYAKIADMLYRGMSVSDERIRDFDVGTAIVFFQQLNNGWFVGVVMPINSYFADLYFSIFMLATLGILFATILSYILLRLSKAKIQSDEENRAKSSFLAKMSHEIRTPLNAIIGIAQIQMQNNDLPEKYEDALEKIYSSGSNLLSIINDILDMSKIETGMLELNPVNYDTPSLINDAVQLNVLRINSKPIDFILNIDENLPSILYGDELRLKQILNNLLSNAIKYTEKGYVKLSVNHLPENEDVILCFTVEDTGQGMKPEDMKKLFSEYARFSSVINRETEGAGLGLNITKKLVEMMGGIIETESEYGKGSTFTVRVRQKSVECSAIGSEISEQLHSFKFKKKRQKQTSQIICELMPYGKVLIVDDVQTNLYVAEGLLSPYKLEIETAVSGFAAIDKIKGGKTFDIIFMDHMMPLMDGIETTQKLRSLGYKGIIVALTANALTGNDKLFIKNGFDGFLTKPIDVRHLDETLNKYICDRYPEEAKKYKTAAVAVESPCVNPQLIRVFCNDAENAIAVLRETTQSGDIKLFTTTVHAMKSALANIGENEASEAAFSLEKAGQSNDTAFIAANVNSFIETLESLITNLAPKKSSGANDADVSEDTAYLIEQMEIIKSACEKYDDNAAYVALDRLNEKPWKTETSAVLEQIRDTLFLHSDFEKVVETIQTFINCN